MPVESDASAYCHRERISMLKALTWDPKIVVLCAAMLLC